MSATFVANGNIRPSRFIKADSSAEHKCLECDAGDPIDGVSHEGERNEPRTGLQDGYAAIAGENLTVYTDGDECYLESGAAFAAGSNLKSDGDGCGVAASSDGEEVGAVARDAATKAGQLVRVIVKSRRQLSVVVEEE